MARTRSIQDGVKYTVVLPESSIRQLKQWVGSNKIDSVNTAVREAVEAYVVKQKHETYRQEMMEASRDPEFIQRNEEVEKGFSNLDREMEEDPNQW